MTDALRPAADFLSRRSVPDPQAPTVRPRRLRTTPAMRRLAREHVVDPSALILPVFVREDIDAPRPVEAMPGVVQHTLDSLRREAAACAEAGIGAIDLFGVPATRDEAGTAAWAEDGILNRGIAAVREEVGDEVVVCADTCLDEFTSHGHCGLIRPDGPRAGEVDNDATLATYQAMAVSQAEAGAHMVSPSGMMDGQVAAIRTALDATAVEQAIGLLGRLASGEAPTEEILSARGRSIRPKTPGQKAYADAIDRATIVFGIGPAGTGKTYLAMAKAVDALARKRVSRIILTRPAVEAGENLGFLPGSLTDKIDPYLRPLYDALHDMLEPEALPRLMAAGTIEVAPLAYMRGRTLNDAFVILDEAQNTSPEQMKMFLTRLGFGSRMVVTGDISQVDLPGGRESGLIVVRKILAGVDGISFCELGSADVVRHRLVGRIIEAYARHDAEVAAQDAAVRPAGPPGRSGRNSQYRRGSSNRPARPYSERNPHDH